MFNNGRNKVGDGLFDLGRRKLMREYDDIEDELFEDFKKRSKPTAHSELSNPPPPTPMLNSGRIFSQQSVNTSTNRLPQFSTSQRLPSNGARHSSSFGSLSNHAKSTVELNTRPSLSHRLVSSFHNENDQTSYMNPSQPIHDETPKEQKYSHLPAFSSSMMQQASQLPKSKSLTKICNNQQQEWLREKPLDFLIENQRETNDNQFNGTKESNEYEDDILKLVQGCYDEPNVNTSPTKEIENIHQQENSEKFRKTNEKKIKSKKKKKNKNKESPFKIENEYSPSQPTLEEDDAQNRRKDHHQQHHAEHQQEVSLRWSKSDKQHSRQKESRPLPPSDRALIRRHQYCAKSIYVDSYVTRIVDNDLLLDDCTDFESSSRRKSSCTDALFSQDLRLLIDEQEVPPFVLSSKTFRLVGLSSNAIFMWTLICSMKYDRLRKNNDQRQRGSYERSLLKQFRKQADYRVIYSGEANDYKSSAPPNTRQLDNFLNSEYHSLIGIKSKQFNDYIPRDIHKYYPLSKRVVNLLMSLPSSLDIEKIGRNDRESSQSNDRSSKSSRYGIPLIDKNKRRQLASRDDSKSISSLTNCIEIDDDEDDSNSKSSYDRSRRNKNDKRAYSDKYKNKSNSPSSTSKRSPKNNSNFSLSNEEKRISEEKSANERIAELRKMLPMIGKKPKKPIKSVKSLLEMTRSKNSVPHKPGPYQPMKVTPSLVPAGKSAQLSTLSSDQNMEMQISDESEHNEDAQPKSEDTIPSQPPLPPPVNEVKDELPPLPPTPPIDSKNCLTH